MIFGVNRPVVPLIRKMSTARVRLANSTVRPTRSWDHFSCFWLGTSPPPGRNQRPAPAFAQTHHLLAAYGSADLGDNNRPPPPSPRHVDRGTRVGNSARATKYATPPQ